MPTTSAGESRSESGVKSTMSANRIDAAANWSAIVDVSALSFSAMERGRMLSSRVSARSCSTCSAASASSRWRTNSTSSPNTTAPPIATLRAIIMRREPRGQGRPADELAHGPRDDEHRHERDEPADARGGALEHQGSERRQDAPQADGARRDEAAHERHRDRRREQDVQQLDPEQPLHVAGAREHRDRHDRDQRVQPGDEARPDAEGEVDGAPDQRDRQDQEADEDEQRLAQPDLVVVQPDRPRSSRRDRPTPGRTG